MSLITAVRPCSCCDLPHATMDGWQACASGDRVADLAPDHRPLQISESERMCDRQDEGQ